MVKTKKVSKQVQAIMDEFKAIAEEKADSTLKNSVFSLMGRKAELEATIESAKVTATLAAEQLDEVKKELADLE